MKVCNNYRFRNQFWPFSKLWHGQCLYNKHLQIITPTSFPGSLIFPPPANEVDNYPKATWQSPRGSDNGCASCLGTEATPLAAGRVNLVYLDTDYHLNFQGGCFHFWGRKSFTKLLILVLIQYVTEVPKTQYLVLGIYRRPSFLHSLSWFCTGYLQFTD